MAVRRPHVPPRHLSFLFVAITVALAAALVWLGVELVRQDRALETQRIRDGLDRVVMAAGTALEQKLAEVQESLGLHAALSPVERAASLVKWGGQIGSGAVVLDVTGPALRAVPPGVLRFDPSFIPRTTASPPEFSTGERLEFRDRDLHGAAGVYRNLARNDNQMIRAGALLRLGRVLRKQGSDTNALAVYEQLAALDPLELDGVPVALTAGHARIGLLESLRRSAEARAEAARLAQRLNDGRWRLTRGSYEYYASELRDRVSHDQTARADTLSVLDEATLLTRATDSLVRAWPGPAADGRIVLAVDSTPLLVVWSTQGATRLAYIATPRHIAREWIAPLQTLLSNEGAALSVEDPAGRPVLGANRNDGSLRVTRTALESRLPWTMSAQSRDPLARSADLAARRRILLTGLVVAVLLVLVGTYAVARAVSRELAVARLQSDFVSAVSHEFRTPLTSLRQVTELLSGGRVSSEANRGQYHEILLRETGRLQRLVENLLDFGRLEAGAHEFRFERISPGDIVAPLVNEFQQEVAGQGYHVTMQLNEVGTVSADRDALGRAIRNLLDNAVKYSPDTRTIEVSIARQNGRVALSVGDHGIGIPRDEQGTIFGQFARGRQVRSSGIPGTGIGLAMVRRIVRAHGGEIRLTSVVGQGSTFTILLRSAET